MAQTAKRHYIGERTVKVDAVERVTGRAMYGADLKLPGMLRGQVLRSPHPHAWIKRLDTSKAERLPGVKAVITANDLPPLDDPKGSFGGELMIDVKHLRDLTIASEKVLFEGQAVAAVAATTPEIAEQARDLIEVEYEVLPVVANALQAMEPDAPLLHEDLYTRTLGEKPSKPSNIAMIMESGFGDVEQGFAEADVVVEHDYETQMVHQGYLEPQATIANVEGDGRVMVWTSTQGTFNVQRMLSRLLVLPLHLLTVVPAEIGGGFGGKIYVILEPLAIMLSQKAGQPVRLIMTREEVFKATGPGSPSYLTVKVGAKKDGQLTSCYAKIIMDAGAFPGSPVGAAMMVAFGPYTAPNMKIDGYDVVTNKPRVAAYRAPGGTPAGFAAESVMDELAEKLGIDPLEFRRINASKEGDRMYSGQKYNSIGTKQVVEAIATSAHWKTPLKGKNRGRGLAIGFWPGATMTSSSEVLINVDGTVTVVTGQVDLTGIRTTMMQMVADELQLPSDMVTVNVVDTNSAPYTDLSAGSRSVYTQSVALHRACVDVLAQLSEEAAESLSKPDDRISPEQMRYADGKFWDAENADNSISWREVAQRSRNRSAGPVVGYGKVVRLQPAPQIAANLVDVEVDPETGKVDILRYTCFQDVGKAINPTQVEGQMQGGVAQGVGWAVTEYYAWENGKMKNPTLLDYRIPTALDLPMLDTVIVEVPASDGPYGARGVGEVPIVPPGAAMANAIYAATGVRMSKLPMTPEEVLWAIKGRGDGQSVSRNS